MKRLLLIFIFITTAGLAWYGSELYRGWQMIQSVDFSLEAVDAQSLQSLTTDLQNLPPVYPYSVVKTNARRGQNILMKLEDFESRVGTENFLHKQTIDELFDLNDEALAIIHDTQTLLTLVPKNWLEPDLQILIADKQQQLEAVEQLLQRIKDAEYTLDYLVQKESSIVILLQNTNEPRSTGGFIGSFIVIDFAADGQIDWRFEDIYALDRKISVDKKIPAPEFFHGLDQTISLKDSNFWPDFPTTAAYIRSMFAAIGQAPPTIIVGTNLKTAETILSLGGPVTLDQWGLTLTAENFDTALQFLVEGKVTGRYSVKEPVALFMQQVFSPEYLSKIEPSTVLNYDWESFWVQKNILAHSTETKLQNIFDTWQLSGRVEKHPLAENFLHFDFVSVGANKSEKFMWTKLDHNSRIASDGTVINTLKIKRTHALQPGEIEAQLGFKSLPENIKNLMNEDLKWKLGAGQNRSVLRVWVPENTELIDQKNPSGEIFFVPNKNIRQPKLDSSSRSNTKKLSYLEIPLFVLPGESLEATVTYQTKIKRGSQNWRPYWLQLSGTPGRKQTKLYTSVSLVEDGKFSAETFNLGRPVDLVDQDFRSVVEFE
jgi:hypothetical protein